MPGFARGLGPELSRLLRTVGGPDIHSPPQNARLVLLGKDDDLAGLENAGVLRVAIEQGATAIVFSPGEKLAKLFPAEVIDAKKAPGEFADFSPCATTMLADGLRPMDLKWWGRKDDWRVFVADTSHRLQTNSMARELVRFIPPHGYIPAEKLPEQYRSVFFEIPLGRGRLWVCDLDLEASISADPAAQRFAMNLLRAASNPGSTKNLPRVLSHEELLKPPSSQSR
ncbi:MAG: hypothetical protein ABIQ35_05240 [Verrucomicrobiota bacterium]